MPMAPDGSLAFYPRCKAIVQVVLDGYATGPGSEDEPLVVTVWPKTATIHGNGYQQADSWELGFSYVDLPFDPQLVRAGSVEVFIYDANANLTEEMATSRQYGLTVGADKGPDATAHASADIGLVPREAFIGDHEPQIAGLFDDHSIEFSEDGKWVSLSGQDYTAYLIAKQWPPTDHGRARRIPVGTRLDTWARGILKMADPGGRLEIFVKDVPESSLPVVGAVEIANHKRGIPVQQNTSYWDVLYKVCTRYGFICYVQGLKVIITKPKNLDDLTDHNVRSLAWGANIKRLELTRHLGKQKVPRIVIHAFDDTGSKLHKIEEPDDSPKRKEARMTGKPSARTVQKETIKSATAKTSAAKPKTKTEHLVDEYIVIPVYGISDESALRRAAKMLRTLIGRGERRIRVETRDLVDANGANLLNIASGDAFDIHWQDFNEEVLANPGVTMERRVSYLVDRGFQRNVAETIAAGYQRLIGKQRPLRLREWTIDYAVDSGIDLSMELVDFVVVEGVRDRDTMTPQREVEGLLRRIGCQPVPQ